MNAFPAPPVAASIVNLPPPAPKPRPLRAPS